MLQYDRKEGSAVTNFSPELLPAGQSPEGDHAHFPISHADIYQIVGEKNASSIQKLARLGHLAISTFANLAKADSTTVPTPRELAEKAIFAYYLHSIRANEEIVLEMLDEAVADFEEISPIRIAKAMAKLDSQYELTEINVLLMKLWTFDRLDSDEMPSRYEKLRTESIRQTTAPQSRHIIRRSLERTTH